MIGHIADIALPSLVKLAMLDQLFAPDQWCGSRCESLGDGEVGKLGEHNPLDVVVSFKCLVFIDIHT